MAHHKSALKRIRTSEKANQRNRHYRSMMRTAIRRLREAQTPDTRTQAERAVGSLIDRLTIKGIIHHRTAARRKSRLAKFTAAANRSAESA